MENEIKIKDSLAIRYELNAEKTALIIFFVKGNLDTYNSGDFEDSINEIILDKYNKIIFDLNELNYISSTGVGAFLGIMRKLKPNGGKMILTGLKPNVVKVFQTLGFLAFLNIKDSIQDAINAV